MEQSKIAEEQKNEAIKANTEAESARMQALDGKNKARQSEAWQLEQKKIANSRDGKQLKANYDAENRGNRHLEKKKMQNR